MGSLVEGRWQAGEVGKAAAGGHYQRKDSSFRDWVTADGSAGAGQRDGFKAEPDRYHLYVSLACPWAHRTMILRAMKGLDSMIPMSIVHWKMGDDGWTFLQADGATGDRLFGSRFLHEVYSRSTPDYTGHVTVPVLWDTREAVIVNNESADILRIFNSAFDGVGAHEGDFYPPPLREEIDRINARVYETLNNGVYKAGFAKSQDAYEHVVMPLFETLDWLEQRLSRSRFLVGDQMTEADIRLFTTLVRFDPVYHGHFKCNLQRIVDYPGLWRFTRELVAMPDIARTVNLFHIKHHYYESHRGINPSGVVPAGPRYSEG